MEPWADTVAERLQYFQGKFRGFLEPEQMELPKDPYWESAQFAELSARCGAGDPVAMRKMAQFFGERSEQDPEEPFYKAAQHFWNVRACQWGDGEACRELGLFFQEHPDPETRRSSPYLSETLCGHAYGFQLRALGFPFFQGKVQFQLRDRDPEGVVLVSRWAGYDGPDDDGFGMEDYDDYWYLDDCLNLPPDGECLPRYSSMDKNLETVKKKFQEQHDTAAAAVRRRKQEKQGYPPENRGGDNLDSGGKNE